jgi:hypothetical protein
LPPEILTEIQKQYSFAICPGYVEAAQALQDDKGIEFQIGRYRTSGCEEIEIALSVHQDGIIVDSQNSTKTSVLFADDLLSWMTKEFGLAGYKELVTRRMFVSEVYITMECNGLTFSPALDSIRKSYARDIGIDDSQVTIGSFGFWIDPAAKLNRVNFRLERTEGVDFELVRYYAVAPLATGKHLDLWETLENAL